MKADVKIFKGIEYVVVNELPPLQQTMLLDTINHDLFIKIMIDGKIISQCLQYKDYSKWYDQKSAITSPTVTSIEVADVHVKTDLAVGKI
jgi:hypothetical protein